MTTVLIIVCIVFCIGIVVAVASHLGHSIVADRAGRMRVARHHRGRRERRRKAVS